MKFKNHTLKENNIKLRDFKRLENDREYILSNGKTIFVDKISFSDIIKETREIFKLKTFSRKNKKGQLLTLI